MFEGIIGFITAMVKAFAGFVGLIILAGMIVIAGVYLYIVNKRYPVVKILLFDRGTMVWTKRRRLGNMLVPDDIITLAIKPRSLFGENIENFQFVRHGNDKVYLARLAPGGGLIPVKYEEAKNLFSDLVFLSGRTVAAEYINSIDRADKLISNANPILTGLLSSLPFSVVVLVMLAGMMAVMDGMNKTFIPALAHLEEISKQQAYIAQTNERILTALNVSIEQTNMTTTPVYQV